MAQDQDAAVRNATEQNAAEQNATEQNANFTTQNTAAEKSGSAALARLAIAALEEKKAEEICVIDISEVSVLADYFVIASGGNRNQIQAMTDQVEETLGRSGASLRQIEGYETAGWVLMDYGDVIVHIFDRENRLFYDLERIWRDGKKIELQDFLHQGDETEAGSGQTS